MHVLIALVLLLVAAPAAAANVVVGKQSTTIVVTGTSGGDDLTASKFGSTGGAGLELVVASTDGTTPVTAGSGCTQQSASSVKCPRPAGETGEWMRFDLGDGDDATTFTQDFGRVVRQNGGPGNDRLGGSLSTDFLDGGPGNDTLLGGTGNDDLQGGEGTDTLVGGGNADIFADDGTDGAIDVLKYDDHDAGVTITLDGQANDGNGTDGPAFGTSSPTSDVIGAGIERIEGSPHADTMTGDSQPNQLFGGAGADTLRGAGGDDVLDARDTATDTAIDCGEGTADTALTDAGDPAPAGCEAVNPGAGGGGGGGGGGTPQQQQPTPAGPPAGTVPACLGAPVNACVNAVSTARQALVPDLTGFSLQDASSLLAVLGIEVDGAVRRDARTASRLGPHPRRRPWAEGMVTKQTVRPGTPFTDTAAAQLKMGLTVWDGPTKETCARQGTELKGLDLDAFEAAMKAYGCTVDDVGIKLVRSTAAKGEADLGSGDRCEVLKATRAPGANAQKKLDVLLQAPTDPALTDLRIGIAEFPGRASLQASATASERWTAPAGGGDAWFVVYVLDRDGAPIDNVEVFIDARDVMDNKAALIQKRTGFFAGSGRADRGRVPVGIDAVRAGTVRIVAFGTPRAGGSVCGATSLRFTDPGKDFLTLSGNYFKKRDGAWKAAEPPAALRAAAIGDVFAGIGSLFAGIWNATVGRVVSGDVTGTLARTEGTVRQRVQQVVKVLDVGLVQLGACGPVGGKDPAPAVPKMGDAVATKGTAIAPVRVPVLTCDKGNPTLGVDAKGNLLAAPLIGLDGSTLIGLDGSTLIGLDGSTLIGLDGATLTGNPASALARPKDIAKAGVLSHNGGTIISRDGAGLADPDSGSLKDAGAPMVAAGGLNLVAAGAGNMVAAGGLN